MRTNLNFSTFHTLDGLLDFGLYDFPNSMMESGAKFGNDGAMFWGTFLHRELERGTLRLESSDVFVDVGANIGMSSRYALLKNVNRVYGFEPDPNLASLYSLNNPEAKVFQYAIDSKSDDYLELFHWPYNENFIGPTYKVSTLSLVDIFKIIGEDTIDYLKVDIEGYEQQAFLAAPQSFYSAVNKIFVEHHFPDMFEDFCKFVEGKGFNVYKEYGVGQNYLYAKQKK